MAIANRRLVLAGVFFVCVAAIGLVLAGNVLAADRDYPTVLSPATATPVVTTVKLPTGALPDAVAVDSTHNRAFVANTYYLGGASTWSVIAPPNKNSSTYHISQTFTLPTVCGSGPNGIAFDPQNATVDIVSSGGTDPCLLALHETNGSTAGSASFGGSPPIGYPDALAIDSSTNAVDVVSGYSIYQQLFAVDRTSFSITPASGGPPNLLQLYADAADTKANLVYVSGLESVGGLNVGEVFVYDATPGAPLTYSSAIPLPTSPYAASPKGIAVNSSTHTVYTANDTGYSVSMIQGTTLVTTTSSLCPPPTSVCGLVKAVAVNPKLHEVYAAIDSSPTCNSGMVDVLSDSNLSLLSYVCVGQGTRAIAVNPQTNVVYAVNQADNSVSVIQF